MVAAQAGKVLRPKENQPVKRGSACESILVGRCNVEPLPAVHLGLVAI